MDDYLIDDLIKSEEIAINMLHSFIKNCGEPEMYEDLIQSYKKLLELERMKRVKKRVTFDNVVISCK